MLHQEAVPPWCVGSVFPAPQLITGDAALPLGPLLFDHCGTRLILDTGHSLQYPYNIQSQRPSLQVLNYLKGCNDAFFPADILVNNLLEDASLNMSMDTSYKRLLGNRLQCARCRDGTYQLLFPTGENMDEIGVYSPSENNLASIIPSEMNCPFKLSVGNPILQIASYQSGEAGCLAVRTLYQVHWFTVQMEDKYNYIEPRAVNNFQSCVSHVSWNPYLPAEAAVVLETGDVFLFDLSLQYKESLNTATGLTCLRRIIPRTKESIFVHKDGSEQMNISLKPGCSSIDNQWRCCEYSWHPRTLLVADSREVCLVDLREKFVSRRNDGSYCTRTLARVSPTMGLNTYCNKVLKREDCFGAFARSDFDGMYQFTTATNCHLLLFDARQPLNPLLQWEHGMQEEPPQLLLTSPLSSLRPLFKRHCQWSSCVGRVLLAAAYGSGNIHGFCYGPEPPSSQLSWENAENGLVEKNPDSVTVMYSWGLPSKLGSSKRSDIDLKTDSNKGPLGDCKNHTVVSKTKLEFDKIAGLCIYPCSRLHTLERAHNDKNQDGVFTILKLTGSGVILAESFKMTTKINCQPLDYSLLQFPYRETTGNGFTGKISKNRYRLEHLSSFLSYIQYGSIVSGDILKKSVLQENRVCHGLETGIIQEEKFNDSQMMGKKDSSTFLGIMTELQHGHSFKKDEYDRCVDSESWEICHEAVNSEFSEIDRSLCPVTMAVKSSELKLQPEEQTLLYNLRDQFQQWQRKFQPYESYLESHF